MTDQKNTKDPLKIGDKVWAEMVVVGIDQEIGCIALSPSSTAGENVCWIGAEGPWVSRESLAALREKNDERLQSCMKYIDKNIGLTLKKDNLRAELARLQAVVGEEDYAIITDVLNKNK